MHKDWGFLSPPYTRLERLLFSLCGTEYIEIFYLMQGFFKKERC